MTDDTMRPAQARDDDHTPGSAPYGPNLRHERRPGAG